MQTKQIIIAVLGILAIQAIVLYALGHPGICSCGTVKIWDGTAHGPQNSQHLLDWYSFSHIIYGCILYFGLRLTNKKLYWSVGALLLAAVAISVGWEIFENTHFAIQRFQTNTISLNYYGDSIINSLMDTLLMALGFSLAYFLPWWIILLAMVGLEVFVLLHIRDNLFLSVVMFAHSFPAVLNWQAALSP